MPHLIKDPSVPPSMCWKFYYWLEFSRQVVSCANDWLIVFKHRFKIMQRSNITINTYFRQNQLHEGPHEPPTMCWKFENWWKVSKGVISGEQKSLNGFRDRFRSKKIEKTVFLAIFYTFSIENWAKTKKMFSTTLAPLCEG